MINAERPISRFPVVDRIADLPPDIRARIEQVAEKSGFIPNVFLLLAHRPDEFRAFFAYHDALMDKPSNLSKAEKEMIVVATSAANDCLYCVIAHGAILRIRSKHPRLAEQVATNYRRAEITPRQRAMLDYALKVAVDSARISEDDWQPLYAHGLTQDDIWEIGAIAAFFAMSNRLANMSALRPNDEFYAMGR
ncbi:peroxidase-related enzyme [Chloroflexus sp.]|uniref:peroxidase-related enzyme n=1 Tax=Chloroflexus sp. TaxID=1904827 RepID=UPI002ACEBC96|nr:peroxidase-related enzyme [Chloroflexus sp.]